MPRSGHRLEEDAEPIDDQDLVVDGESVEGATPAATPPPPPAAASTPIPSGVLDLATACKWMTKATSRSEVADAIIGHARGLFTVSVLLVVRNELATGWKGFGPELTPDRIETLLVPLGPASMFRSAVDTSDLCLAHPDETLLHAHVWKVLRQPTVPAQVVVLPVLINERVVNLLYGHRAHGSEKPFTVDELEGLRALAKAASDGYVRLIATMRKGSPTATEIA